MNRLSDRQLHALGCVCLAVCFGASLWIVTLYGAVAGALSTLISVATLLYGHTAVAVGLRRAQAQRVVDEAEAVARKAAR